MQNEMCFFLSKSGAYSKRQYGFRVQIGLSKGSSRYNHHHMIFIQYER